MLTGAKRYQNIEVVVPNLKSTPFDKKKEMILLVTIKRSIIKDYLLLHKKVLLKDLTHLLEMVQFYLLMVDVHITQKQKVWLL